MPILECFICSEKLDNAALVSSLKLHLSKKHCSSVKQNVSYFCPLLEQKKNVHDCDSTSFESIQKGYKVPEPIVKAT